MTTPPEWRKSSRSNVETSCVELPNTLDAVRDSKNGAVLQLTNGSVAGLVAAVKATNQQVR